MRRTLIVTTAPSFSRRRRIDPAVALAILVPANAIRRTASTYQRALRRRRAWARACRTAGLHRIVAQLVVIAQVLGSTRDRMNTSCNERFQRVHDAVGITAVAKASRRRSRSRHPRRNRPQPDGLRSLQSEAGSRYSLSASVGIPGQRHVTGRTTTFTDSARPMQPSDEKCGPTVVLACMSGAGRMYSDQPTMWRWLCRDSCRRLVCRCCPRADAGERSRHIRKRTPIGARDGTPRPGLSNWQCGLIVSHAGIAAPDREAETIALRQSHSSSGPTP